MARVGAHPEAGRAGDQGYSPGASHGVGSRDNLKIGNAEVRLNLNVEPEKRVPVGHQSSVCQRCPETPWEVPPIGKGVPNEKVQIRERKACSVS